ncbi:MAG: sugar ABC transporter substrate-binding protein [Candidatus Syntrophonatronum acetioxidans]|uniref:Sugar ABC transporter substrate-binding protein n=1 Tax=Candidatus Syntrophonatronum acetioxidans TaxID=1795816 RepID=A0A424YHH4_9FIRM|nr:MAG: sugar ABC transporter substrate-binding protein [Candidatus Syntrophonatronum acetioxidans]
MKRKNMIAVLLSIFMLLSIFGCGGEFQDRASSDVSQDDSLPDLPESLEDDNDRNVKVLEIEKELMDQLEPMPEKNTGQNIGALLITLANPFWVAMKEAYEKAADEMGVEIEVMAAPTEGDTRSQLETLEAMVAKDFEALIVSPIEPFNLVPGVVKANEKDIKVINLGPPIDKDAVAEAGGHLDGRITVDFEDQGVMGGEYIVERLGDQGGKVAIIQGIPGAGQSEGRTAGAKKVFDNSEKVDLVSVQPGNWDRNTAYNVATNLIQAHPDLKGIFSCNDVMALAAADAMKAAGKRDEMVIVGVDFIPEAQEAIKDGKLDASVGYSMEVYGKAAVVLAMKIIQGHDIPDKVYSPLIIAHQKNIDDFDGFK